MVVPIWIVDSTFSFLSVSDELGEEKGRKKGEGGEDQSDAQERERRQTREGKGGSQGERVQKERPHCMRALISIVHSRLSPLFVRMRKIVCSLQTRERANRMYRRVLRRKDDSICLV